MLIFIHMDCLILTVGNEIASGLTINTNAAFIAKELEKAGITPKEVLTVRDDIDSLAKTIRQATKNFGLVIITGGLGPTHDDVTKPALLKAFKIKMTREPAILHDVEKFFKKLGTSMSPTNLGQADIPDGFTPLKNRWGTAPGLFREADNSLLFALPGVPREMRGLMQKEVMPILLARGKTGLARIVIKTAGVGESPLYEKIEPSGILKKAEIAFLPQPGRVDIRVTVPAKNQKTADRKLADILKKIRPIIAPYTYGKNETTLEKEVGRLLVKKGMTLACAESCTGGLFATAITDVGGSSRYFIEGAVTYSDNAKVKRLKVKQSSINKFGAVSEEVAKEMATGITKTTGADIGISATGIAGPDGGSSEKPVGLVYIGLHMAGETKCQRKIYRFDRKANRERTVTEMLTWLYFELKGIKKNGR